MKIDDLRYFNTEKKLDCKEHRSALGRVSYKFSKPGTSQRCSITTIFSRTVHHEFNEKSSKALASFFQNDLARSFASHRRDPVWIKEIGLTITALKSMNTHDQFSEAISQLEPIYKQALLLLPLDASSSESLTKDKELMLSRIKFDPAAFKHAHPSLKKDVDFLMSAYRENASVFDVSSFKDAMLAIPVNESSPDSIKKNQNFILVRIKYDPSTYFYAHSSLKEEADFVLRAFASSEQIFYHMTSNELSTLVTYQPLILNYNPFFIQFCPNTNVASFIKSNPDLIEHLSDKQKSDKQLAIEIVRANGLLLEKLDQFKKDPDVVCEALKQNASAWSFVKELDTDMTYVNFLITQNLLPYADVLKYKDHKELVLSAAKYHPQILEEVEEFLKDKEFALSLVRQNGLFLKYTKDYQNDPDFVLEATGQNPQAIIYAASTLQADNEFLRRAASCNGLILQYIKDHQKDRDIVLAAIKENPRAIFFADSSLRRSSTFIKEAIGQNGLVLEFVKEFQNNADVVKQAIEQNPQAWVFASHDLKKNPELIQIWFKDFFAGYGSERCLEIANELSKLIREDSKFEEVVGLIKVLEIIPSDRPLDKTIRDFQALFPDELSLNQMAELMSAWQKVPDSLVELAARMLKEVKAWHLTNQDFTSISKVFLKHVDSISSIMPDRVTDEDFSIIIKQIADVPENLIQANCEWVVRYYKSDLEEDKYLVYLKDFQMMSKQMMATVGIFACGSSLSKKDGWNINIRPPLVSSFYPAVLGELLSQIEQDIEAYLTKPDVIIDLSRLERLRELIRDSQAFLKTQSELFLLLQSLLTKSNLEGKPRDASQVIDSMFSSIASLQKGQGIMFPITLGDTSGAGHFVELQIQKQDNGNYTLTVFNTGFGIDSHKVDDATQKIYPFVIKDVNASLLDKAFCHSLLYLNYNLSKESLSEKFKHFYEKIQKLGTRADDEETPYYDQGNIGNCTYKATSKALHKILGDDYEPIKVLLHEKILSTLKGSLNAFYSSAIDTGDATFKSSLLHGMYRDKFIASSIPAAGKSPSIAGATIISQSFDEKQLDKDEFVYYSALMLTEEIKKTTSKVKEKDREIIRSLTL